MKIDLIQPRHNYAPPIEKEPKGHIYLNASLLSVGSRLMHAGADVTFRDENLHPRQINSNLVGINLLGAPYVPEAIKIQKETRRVSDDIHFLMGGKVISGFTSNQFQRLFGTDTSNGNMQNALAQHLGISPRKIPTMEEVTIIPALETISDEDMREYLSREFAFYVSQGCKFACDFCAAVRTAKDPVTGNVTHIKEVYRNLEGAEKELDYLMTRAEKLDLKKLSFYMTNLDVFQTPDKLLEFAKIVKMVRQRHPNMQLEMRGLATVDSFLKTREKKPEAITELMEAGYTTTGFGVDGSTPEVWRKLNKGQNTPDKCLEAIRSAREDFGMTPEILMVFGHAGIDTKDSLRLAVDFTQDMVTQYGAVPRPHIAKGFIPGNNGWHDAQNQPAIEQLINDPECFQTLDFTALPSSLTHPDTELRKIATDCYLEICAMPENTTLPIIPITPDLTRAQRDTAHSINEGKYDR